MPRGDLDEDSNGSCYGTFVMHEGSDETRSKGSDSTGTVPRGFPPLPSRRLPPLRLSPAQPAPSVAPLRLTPVGGGEGTLRSPRAGVVREDGKAEYRQVREAGGVAQESEGKNEWG